MLLLVDHLALRARSYEYLIRLFQEWEVGVPRPPGRGAAGGHPGAPGRLWHRGGGSAAGGLDHLLTCERRHWEQAAGREAVAAGAPCALGPVGSETRHEKEQTVS